jgi:O-acetyl-ADP-ribose deacetylase (regulator of RNase III)
MSKNSYLSYTKGDLIKLAKQGSFDAIAHGCNCFCKQEKGLALGMRQQFDTNNATKYPLEGSGFYGDINKLGQVQHSLYGTLFNQITNRYDKYVAVYNMYTQYRYDQVGKPFDYDAFTLCLRKLNHSLGSAEKTNHIGLPMIGTHLAGGDWDKIEKIILKELKDCTVTIVEYEPV